VSTIEFVPKTPQAKNVTPWGQTTSKPIMNITAENYGGAMNFSWAMPLDSACVNLTIGNSSNKSDGDMGYDDWYLLKNNAFIDLETLNGSSYIFYNETYYWVDEANCTDNNWNTYGNIYGNGDGDIFVNYTKPSIFTSLFWEVKSENITRTQVQIPTSCTDQPTLQLDYNINCAFSGTDYNTLKCYNGTSFMEFYNRNGTGMNGCSNFYEEQLIVDNNNIGIWMWADYNCTSSTWSKWEPTIYFRACCVDCICSEDIT
jgi:hypothetical protein